MDNSAYEDSSVALPRSDESYNSTVSQKSVVETIRPMEPVDLTSSAMREPGSLDHQTENFSYIQTEVKAPLLNIPAPVIQVSTVPLTNQLLTDTVSSAYVQGRTSEGHLSEKSEQLIQQGKEEEKRRQQEAERIRHKHEKDVEKEAEKRRKEAEKDAEKIRKILEKQHEKDVEFRKDIVEKQIDTQKKLVDVEEKYAIRELKREEKIAVDILDSSTIQTAAEVRLTSDTAGTRNVAVAEKTTVNQTTTDTKSLGTRLKDWLLG